MKFSAPFKCDPPNSGLTLLELVIVVAILAVLTTIASRSLFSLGDQAKFESNEEFVREFRRALLGDPQALQSDFTAASSGFIADLGRPPRVSFNTNLYAAEQEADGSPTPYSWNLPEMLTSASLSGLPYRHYPLDATTLVYATNLSTAPTIDADSKLPVGWRGPYMQGFTQTQLQDSWGKPITAYATANYRYLVDWWVPTYGAYSGIGTGGNPMVPTNVDNAGFAYIGSPGIPVSVDQTAVTGLILRSGPASGAATLAVDTYSTNYNTGIVYPNEYVSQLTVLVTVGGGITNAMQNDGEAASLWTNAVANNYRYTANVILYSPNPFYQDPRLAASYSGSRTYNYPVAVSQAFSATPSPTTNYNAIFQGTPISVTFTNFISKNAGFGAGEPLSPIAYPLVQGPKVIKAIVTATKNPLPASALTLTSTNVVSVSRNIVLRPGYNTIQISVP